MAGRLGRGTVTTPDADEVVRAVGGVLLVNAIGAAAVLPVSYPLCVGFAAVLDHQLRRPNDRQSRSCFP